MKHHIDHSIISMEQSCIAMMSVPTYVHTQATEDNKETVIEVTSEGCTFSSFGKETVNTCMYITCV